ncbi:peroxyureidoacrylate/ureidoacrylate amidohydrolase RutB [mine drainage metagenome]|uniref:Peroxyureidoacrylate/ureidoacrylate amidohydrolase RutB n=1 Tax=mine drainage metagenome TaxID=410659 RepID=A0A1J5R4F4_9ZZZZ
MASAAQHPPALRRDTALLVIDMQRDFLDPRGYAACAGLNTALLRQAIPGAQRLLAAARRRGMVVIHTRESHRADLSDCPSAKLERAARAGAPIGTPGPLGRLLVRGEHGHNIIDELAPLAGEPVVDKPGYSVFHQIDLQQILAAQGIGELILCGVTTEVCVHSTLRAAVDLGYRCRLAGDACASAYPALHHAALDMVAVEGGIFGSVHASATLADAIDTMPREAA